MNFLRENGLENCGYYGGDRSQPIIETVIGDHINNSTFKVKKYYTKETALMAYEIFERDHKVLGFDFPFPEWLQ